MHSMFGYLTLEIISNDKLLHKEKERKKETETILNALILLLNIFLEFSFWFLQSVVYHRWHIFYLL